MKLVKVNYLKVLFLTLAVFCLGQKSYCENDSNDFHKKTKENSEIGTSLSIKLTSDYLESDISASLQEFEEEVFDDDNENSVFFKISSYKRAEYLNQDDSFSFLYSKIKSIKTPLFILYCSLKLPFVI